MYESGIEKISTLSYAVGALGKTLPNASYLERTDIEDTMSNILAYIDALVEKGLDELEEAE